MLFILSISIIFGVIFTKSVHIIHICCKTVIRTPAHSGYLDDTNATLINFNILKLK